jgi:three-Cys-motif partner protein
MGQVRLDEVGNWSEIKLEIIRKYAAAYSQIMSSQPSIRRHIYIDAFAGAGQHVSRAKGTRIPGSPANALAVSPPFSEYHWIDLNSGRVGELRRLAQGRSEVHIYEGDCNEILLDRVFERCRYEDYGRGLCLLDPYKLNVQWAVLATAGSMKSVEIFYNFMIMDANMNVLWRNPDSVRPVQAARMTAVWGDESWRDAAYSRQQGLFEEIEDKRSNQAIAEEFRKRLKAVAGFEYVPEPLPMKNTKGATVYFLYFASPNRIGAKIVSEIFNKYR